MIVPQISTMLILAAQNVEFCVMERLTQFVFIFGYANPGENRMNSKAKKKISRVSTNSIDPDFGESGIFFFFCFFC